MVLDHICRNRACVNPGHLRVVTPKQNVLENSLGRTAINKCKTHCPKGHPFDDENTFRAGTQRQCRECGRIRHRKHMNLTRPNPPRVMQRWICSACGDANTIWRRQANLGQIRLTRCGSCKQQKRVRVPTLAELEPVTYYSADIRVALDDFGRKK
jgi:transcription elongation factor Elf1